MAVTSLSLLRVLALKTCLLLLVTWKWAIYHFYIGRNIRDLISDTYILISNLKLGQTLQSATLKFGIIYEEMYLSWLDELICELENRN